MFRPCEPERGRHIRTPRLLPASREARTGAHGPAIIGNGKRICGSGVVREREFLSLRTFYIATLFVRFYFGPTVPPHHVLPARVNRGISLVGLRSPCGGSPDPAPCSNLRRRLAGANGPGRRLGLGLGKLTTGTGPSRGPASDYSPAGPRAFCPSPQRLAGARGSGRPGSTPSRIRTTRNATLAAWTSQVGLASGGRSRRAPYGNFYFSRRPRARSRIGFFNDPSTGSPTETLLRLLLPLKDQVRSSSQQRRRRGDATACRSEDLTKSFNR